MGRSDRWVRAMRIAATFVAMGGGLVVSEAARADDCQGDVSRLSQKRQSFIDQLNHSAKGPKGQLDAESSCPKLRGLAGAERELLGYLTKNKDWCQVPDEAITNITASLTKSNAIATQACNVAAQMRKAQQQAANGGGATGAPIQKLPAGPL